MNMESSGHPDDLRTSEEAAAWLLRLEHDDRPEVRAEFAAWIKRAAAHLEEFLYAQAIWRELDRVDRSASVDQGDAAQSGSVLPFPSRAEARGAAASLAATGPGAAQASLPGLPAPKRRRRRLGPLGWVGASAASLAAIVCGWMLLSATLFGARVYATAIGDQKAIKLADGSLIQLNTDSRAEVRYSQHERWVHLLAGEALFTVAHDPSRPFIVQTDSARVRAVGTQFDVYRSSAATTRVAVLNGVVQLSTLAAQPGPGSPAARGPAAAPAAHGPAAGIVALAAGDAADVDRGRIVRDVKPNVERAVAWRERRLIFSGDPVSAVAEQFNRYNPTPIRVEGEALRRRPLSGVFDADDPSPLIEFLARDPNVVVIREPDQILIRPRGDDAGGNSR